MRQAYRKFGAGEVLYHTAYLRQHPFHLWTFFPCSSTKFNAIDANNLHTNVTYKLIYRLDGTNARTQTRHGHADTHTRGHAHEVDRERQQTERGTVQVVSARTGPSAARRVWVAQALPRCDKGPPVKYILSQTVCACARARATAEKRCVPHLRVLQLRRHRRSDTRQHWCFCARRSLSVSLCATVAGRSTPSQCAHACFELIQR